MHRGLTPPPHLRSGFPLTCLQKIPGLSKTPKTFVQDFVVGQQHRYTDEQQLLTVWQYNQSWNVHHKLQRNCLVSTQQQYGTLYVYLYMVFCTQKWWLFKPHV